MDKPTIAAYDDAANRSAYLDLKSQHKAHPVLDFFISRIPQNGLVLDLGCGVGAEAAIMVQHGLRVDAVDASQGMVDCAQEVHGIAARLATFDDLGSFQNLDGVWAHFSLLHAPRQKLPEYLKDIFNALNPNGVLYISMKCGSGEHRDGLGRFYNYYEVEELERHLQSTGFELVFTNTGTGTGLDEDVMRWVMFLGFKPQPK
ncbi:methyltransferase [Tateyamaria omphalii]|uniref:class I SAM-dependent DNA methyltransferase n=1 Tax=Tateyamaria omphalii TaxID=299262 RepID=UPI001676A685|nr:class I SAM-dependent methyltransferase [Tateyamaria omphalii]GGX69220.1 methyltransferase [Tateyamaria omphalii]